MTTISGGISVSIFPLPDPFPEKLLFLGKFLDKLSLPIGWQLKLKFMLSIYYCVCRNLDKILFRRLLSTLIYVEAIREWGEKLHLKNTVFLNCSNWLIKSRLGVDDPDPGYLLVEFDLCSLILKNYLTKSCKIRKI